MLNDMVLTLSALAEAYSCGVAPADVIREVYRRIEVVDDPALFLHLRPIEDVLSEADALPEQSDSLPLWGVPYVVKDNIDVGGIPTTAGCPAYAYVPERDAFVVARLRAAGALVIGKANLDQFATGLAGVRSPHGTPRNAVDPAIVPGGSSSGSSAAVGHGIVTFSLGTDTAGSGRVPAALNGIVGLKPSLGAISATGVVPACRTLDTVSILAATVADAFRVFEVACAYDPSDPFSKRIPLAPLTAPAGGQSIGVPNTASLRFFGDSVQEKNFADNVARLRAMGNDIVELDFTDLYAVADLLYQGAWVAERYTVVERLMQEAPEALHPVTAQVIGAARDLSAADAFRGLYRLKDLSRRIEIRLEGIDLLCVPTIPRFYSCAELEDDPFTPNSVLGTYTNFVNLLDMCGIAVPSGPRSDGRPGSITLLGRSGADAQVSGLAAAFAGETSG